MICPCRKAIVATTADEARQAFQKIGAPIAMKILSADVAHKTDAGGVVLNVDSEDAAAKAFDQILTNVKAHAPKAKIDGVLLEEMKPPGIEMTAGLINDPDFGPLVMVGLGGIFIEVLKRRRILSRAARHARFQEYDRPVEGRKNFKGNPRTIRRRYRRVGKCTGAIIANRN